MLKINFVLILSVAVASCVNDEEWMKCKPKPGCSIPQCDPTPNWWFVNGRGPDDGYSILCQKSAASLYDSSDHTSKYDKIFKELLKLKTRLKKAEDEGEQLKLAMKRLEEESTELKSLIEEERIKSRRAQGDAFNEMRRLDENYSKLQNHESSGDDKIAETEKKSSENVSSVFSSCKEAGKLDGTVKIQSKKTYKVYCDMSTDDGNWIVFQRRMDGSVDFYRTWEEYATGFGNKSGEFWLGLEAVHQLTQNGNYELRVDLTDWNGTTRYAKYGTFKIGRRSSGYKLIVRGYSGTAGDSLGIHNRQRFSTEDKDLDKSDYNCAVRHHAAWWFASCGNSSLNGRYNDTSSWDSGLFWFLWGKRSYYSLKSSEMKFRKK